MLRPDNTPKTIVITFPDGNQREYNSPVTGQIIAASISKSLEKETVAVKVNGELKDLSLEIKQDSTVSVIKADSEE
jgi:threonyl-tRNA synthetase